MKRRCGERVSGAHSSKERANGSEDYEVQRQQTHSSQHAIRVWLVERQHRHSFEGHLASCVFYILTECTCISVIDILGIPVFT